MQKLLLSLAVIFISLPLLSQEKMKKNDIYFEFLGNGIGSSFNYERGITKNQQLRFRVGVGYYSGDQKFRLSVPAGISYLLPLQNKTSFIEVGLGVTNSHIKGWAKEKFQTPPDSMLRIDTFLYRHFSFVPSVGFRKQTKNNWMWRISFTPIINDIRVLPWGGISIGKRF